ncbi:Hypothetical predicted protein [Paramuricea clavata]|uniref:Uncharacterized protein n=1 Tax=Paramuricea clavata TaxID=317549 RepID=A0A6S7GJR8_PARCT|nr:Hypothetical predicted protein [Paramuricea clavata]
MERQLILFCVGLVLFSVLITILLTFKYRYRPRRIHVASHMTDPYQNFKDVKVHQLYKALKRMSIIANLQEIDVEEGTTTSTS